MSGPTTYDRLRALLDHVEALPIYGSSRDEGGDTFDMGIWHNGQGGDMAKCGTRACLAGWAVDLNGTGRELNRCINGDNRLWIALGGKLLGLDPHDNLGAWMHWQTACRCQNERDALEWLRQLVAMFEPAEGTP